MFIGACWAARLVRYRGVRAAPAAPEFLGSLPFLSGTDAFVLPALRGLVLGLVIRIPALDRFFRSHGCLLCNRERLTFGLALLRGRLLGRGLLWLGLARPLEVYGVLKLLPFSRTCPRVGGETSLNQTTKTARQGLSPRGRGNHAGWPEGPGQQRSIPAWAGTQTPVTCPALSNVSAVPSGQFGLKQ